MGTREHAPPRELSCPSAQPDMVDARVFGLISGPPEEPRISYLEQWVVVEVEALAALQPLAPTHVFRFAARCEESRCSHHDGVRCDLGRRVVEMLEPVVEAAPLCVIRPTCRWFAEQGAEACRRCPQVVTMIPEADDALNRAARSEQDGGR